MPTAGVELATSRSSVLRSASWAKWAAIIYLKLANIKEIIANGYKLETKTIKLFKNIFIIRIKYQYNFFDLCKISVACLAQLAERKTEDLEVAGSTPAAGIIFFCLYLFFLLSDKKNS